MLEHLRNSGLFREVNERIRDVSTTWGDADDPIGFVCECGDPECRSVLSLTIADYEVVRTYPHRFLFRGGHETPGTGRVVERMNGYVVVDTRAGVTPQHS